MLRRILLAAAAVGAMMTGLPRAAEAVVTYTLVDQVYGFTGSPAPQVPQETNFSFNVSDAAVARGSFNLTVLGGDQRNAVFGGDVADFVRINASDQTVAFGSTFLIGTSSLRASFAPSGTLASLALSYVGFVDSIFLTSTGDGRVAGTYLVERNGCAGGQLQCTVSGRFVASVPEPMSLALLGMGLLGMAAVRRTA